MNLTLLLVAMVIFAFGCSHWLAKRAEAHGGPSGIEYVILGWLLGPQLEPFVLTQEYLDKLGPLISLMLGLIGFIVGVRARTAIKRADAAVAGTLVSLVVSCGVGLSVLGVQYWLARPDVSSGEQVHWVLWESAGWRAEVKATADQLWLALTLGAAASIASTHLLRRLSAAHGDSVRTLSFLTSVAGVTELFALGVLGVTLAAARGEAGASQLGMGITEWFIAAAGLGVLCGALFTLLIGREQDHTRMFLTSVGVVTFASGIGSALGVSPLFVNLLLGLTVAVSSPHAESLTQEVARLSQPVNVLVLVFAGALWRPVSGWMWLLPPAYVAARYALLRVAVPAAAFVTLEEPLRTRRMGHALLGQGGLAVAVAVSISLRFPEIGPAALTTVLASTLLGDVRAEQALRTVLVDSANDEESTLTAGGVHRPEAAVMQRVADERERASQPRAESTLQEQEVDEVIASGGSSPVDTDSMREVKA